ncbi:hypothetical protein VTI28DRAFT_4986 [Corynascus sepedonium]
MTAELWRCRCYTVDYTFGKTASLAKGLRTTSHLRVPADEKQKAKLTAIEPITLFFPPSLRSGKTYKGKATPATATHTSYAKPHISGIRNHIIVL